jgi:hypothetical protein
MILKFFVYMWIFFVKCMLKIVHDLSRFAANVILTKLLGWKIDKSYDDYKILRKGKHVLTYTHTSEYEIAIACLLAYAYDLPIVTVAKDEMGKIPIISKLLSVLTDMIFIDKKNNISTTDFVAKELKDKNDFVLLISPEGSRKKVDDIKSGFYNIANESNSDIYHIAVDFENHTIATKHIVNDAIVQTKQYEKIKKLVEDEMRKDKPYYVDQCHLVDPLKISQTSLMDKNRSMLIYIPPLVVLLIVVNIFVRSLFK